MSVLEQRSIMSRAEETVSIRERLRENDPTLTTLQIWHWMGLLQEESIRDFLQALSGNSVVDTIYINAQSAELLERTTVERIL